MEQYKFDVYETYDDDKHKFKLAKLEIFQPSLKEFYDIFNKALTKLYEVTSDLLDLYDQVKNLYDYKLPRTYNCINRDLAKQYENCILKEKKLVETITNIQTSTCYSDLKNWAEIKKQTCINAIKQDGPYNKAKSDYLKLESASRQLENYFYSEKQDQQHLFTMRSNIFRRVQQYNANINATLDHYVNEMLKMKILNYGTNAIKVYSDVFTGKCKIGVWREVDDWSYQLRSEKKDFQKQINSIDFYGRECGSLNEQLQTSLEDIEELNVRPTKQLVENFVSGQIFVVQNGSQMEVDCENHVPFYGILPNENLTLLNKTEDDTEVLNIRGKDKNNKSYVRTLEVKFVENKRVELHELIRYENSETDFLNENYLILFKTTL